MGERFSSVFLFDFFFFFDIFALFLSESSSLLLPPTDAASHFLSGRDTKLIQYKLCALALLSRQKAKAQERFPFLFSSSSGQSNHRLSQLRVAAGRELACAATHSNVLCAGYVTVQ